MLVLSAAALLLAGSVVHVPAGAHGYAGRRLLDPGWRLRLPFTAVRVLPDAGALTAEVDRPTPEGATARVRFDLAYRIGTGLSESSRRALESGGPQALASRAARAAVDAMDPRVVLPSGGGARIDALPPPQRDALRAALEGAGLSVLSLDARAGPAGAFPPSGTPLSPAAGPSPVIPPTATSAPASGAPARQPTGVRLVLVGLDGADWGIIDPLLRQGRLPRLARLLETGARAAMRSYDPMISPLLWTTVATGVGPDVHGVADFQAIETRTGRRIPITSRFRRVKALWNVLGDASLTSAFVAWWASYPAEPVCGFDVTNLVSFETVRPRPTGRPLPAGLTFPADYLDRISPRLITAADLTYDDVRPILHVTREEFEAARREVLAPPAADGREGRRAVQRPLPLALSILTGSRNYASIAADLAARRPDLTAVYFEGIDMMGHRFQHCLPPRMAICADADYARFQDAVTSFYAYQDRLLGQVIDAAGAGATVLVISDHGFRHGAARPPDILPYTTEEPVEWHEPEGIFLLSGPAARRGVRLSARPTLFDVAPTVLYLLGLPAGQDMPGRVFTEALDPAFAAAHEARRIPSWEAVGGPRQGEGGAPSDDAAREAEADLISSLRSLGYVGGDEGEAHRPAAAPDGGSTPADTGAEGTQVFYHRNLATYFLKRQDYAHAAEQLRLANDRQRLPKSYQMLSEAYLGMGRREEAIAALRQSLDEIPDSDPEPVLWLVQLALEQKDGRDEALGLARTYAARTAAKPGLDDAIAGLLEEAAGNADAARDHDRRSFAADPLRVLVAERLYALLPREARAAALQPALERAVRRDPRLDEYHDLLGVLAADAGRDEDAVAAFRAALDLDPDNPRFAANLGGALARLGRWDAAAEAYERAMALQATPATALKLGSVYRRLGRPGDALAAFRRARDLGDATSAPALGVALAQSEAGRPGDAIATLEKALADHPGDASLQRLYKEVRKTTRPAPGREASAGVTPH